MNTTIVPDEEIDMPKTPSQIQADVDDYLSSAPEVETTKTSGQLDAEIAEMVNPHEAKQERRRERLEGAADRARAESERAFGASRRVLDAIPFGQPILVGHHSERRHRRDIEKSDRAMRKGIDTAAKAKDLARRAEAVGTGGISSDDPEAVKKLKTELAQIERAQEQMKAANLAIRKYASAGPEAQVAALVALGHAERRAAQLLEKDFMGRIGFPDYAIKNNGANIRRIEKRIAELGRREETPARDPIVGEVDGLSFTISESKEANRTQITFSGKPGPEIRDRLKSAGFR